LSALLDYLLELRDRDFAQQFLVFVELPSSRQEGAFCRAELLLLGSVQEADELVVGCVRVSGGVHEEVSAAGGTVALEALFGHGEGGHPGQVGAYAHLGGIGGEREEVRHVGHKTASLPSRSVPTSCSSCWLTASGEMLSSTTLRSVQPTPRLRALTSPPDGGQNPNALPISSCYERYTSVKKP